jgi:hypothetical protein
VNSLQPGWRKDLEDLKKTVPRRPRLRLPDVLQRLAHTNTTLLARIEWCRRQRTQARTQAELEGWRAEEEGLRDALLNGDRTYEYRHSTAAVFKRYVMGLKQGQVLIRLAWVDCI